MALPLVARGEIIGALDVQDTQEAAFTQEEVAVLQVLADQLAQLPADYRDVLVLRHLEGLSFGEVAERMGRSPGAVRMLWLRAIDQLRERLDARGLT